MILQPHLAFNKALLKININRSEIELFKQNLILLLGTLN
jgi:hypothetical protein